MRDSTAEAVEAADIGLSGGLSWQEMLLSPGSVIGPYKIIGPIGAGGMGEVYRARDTRLAREVALKIVSATGLNKPDRQDRFEREARAASGLNHPNILTIHDIGVEDGIPFIVSELVPGETLRKLVSKGPLPVRTLLNLAVQIADGLAAAHERRIVHRDLKPDNIMVTPDARVKILDFGLAKAVAIAEDDSAATVTMTATEPGIVLGTVPYMSPEQARGATVDFRSDQFAFGLILYEMASGKQAFRRDTAVQTLSAILTEEAPPLDAGLPAPLRWIIARCLAKDPNSRYAATSDLHREIVCLRENLSEISNAIPSSAAQPPRAKRQITIAAAAAIGLAAGVLAAWLWWQRPTTNLASQRYTPLAAEAAAEGFPSWSANGRTVAYSADVAGIYQIFTRSLESAIPAQITRSVRDCIYPFWSPSGSRIYYISRDTASTELWSVGAAGGEPELVVADAVAAAMSTDGHTLALLRSGVPGLWISSDSGANIRKFADAPGSEIGGFIRFSPDGKKLACWVGSTYSEAQFRVFPYPGGGNAGRLAGRAWDQRFLHGARPFNWMPDSEHIVFEARQPSMASYHLWISDLDGHSIQPLTASTADEAYPAVSPDGKRIAFMVMPTDWDLVEIPVDGTPMRNLLSTPGYESWPAWSPRSEQIAYSTTRSGAFEIWLRSVRDGWDRPLVTGKDFGQEPTAYLTQSTFSPEGQRIAYTRNGGQSVAIWISRIEGGPPVKVVLEPAAVRPDSPTWSPDGNWLAFVSTRPGGLVLAKARASADSPAIDLSKVAATLARWSPGGDWILCVTNEGLGLISPDGKSRRNLRKAAPLTIGWAKDGDRVYGVDNRNRRLVLFSIDTRSGGEQMITDLGPAPLDPAPYLYSGAVRGFSMAPDGKTFAISILRPKSDIWLLEGFHAP